MDKLIALIKELIAKCFYGELTIKFEHGKIVLIGDKTLIGLFIWERREDKGCRPDLKSILTCTARQGGES